MTQRIKIPFGESVFGFKMRPIGIPSGEIIADKSDYTIYVSELDYYKIIFATEVSDDSVQFACDYARSKLNKFIDSL